MFSGRAFIWSQYLTAWLRGDTIVFLFGLGPDAWQGVFTVYAHNTFVSYLYEYGLFGLLGITVVFGAYFSLALSLTGSVRRLSVISAFSFLILNLATMPLWQVEGNLLFAILLGQVWYMHAAQRARRGQPFSGEAARSIYRRAPQGAA